MTNFYVYKQEICRVTPECGFLKQGLYRNCTTSVNSLENWTESRL